MIFARGMWPPMEKGSLVYLQFLPIRSLCLLCTASCVGQFRYRQLLHRQLECLPFRRSTHTDTDQTDKANSKKPSKRGKKYEWMLEPEKKEATIWLHAPFKHVMRDQKCGHYVAALFCPAFVRQSCPALNYSRIIDL